MQDAGDETGDHACQKGKNKCCPRTHTSADQHDGNRTSGCKRTVHGQIRKIQQTVGNIDAECHQPPDHALGESAGHGTEEGKRVKRHKIIHQEKPPCKEKYYSASIAT